MGRFRQVSRTVEYTEAVIMAVDIATQKVEHITVTLSGTFDTNEKLLKSANEQLEAGKKGVAVELAEVQEKTFAMPETMFIEQAMPVPIGKRSLNKADFEAFYHENLEGDDEELEADNH